MRFRRSHDVPGEFPQAGAPGVLDGQGAVLRVEALAADVLVVPSARDADALFASAGVDAVAVPAADGGALRVHEASPRELPALLAGFALEGMRAAALVEHLGPGVDGLAAAAGRHLPVVVHLMSRARTRQSAAVHSGHDDYHAAADSGAFLMFARNPQEAADHALIARRVAERALVPGLCAQDLYQTSHAVRNLRAPESALVTEYLGRPGDTVACASEAERVLFGESRRRVPVWLDVDRPAGIGGVQERESHFRAAVSQQVYFADALPAIVDDAMREFGERTGRAYARVSGHRVEDAEVVVVGQGALMDDLVGVVDYLRSEKKIKAGVINIAVLRPFAGGELTGLLAGRKAVAVLERTGPALSDAPLLRDVRAAIDRATENGQSPDAPAWPDHATFRRLDERPRLYSGLYGAGADLPSFAELAAVFEHLASRAPARRFYVGAGLDTETRRFPHLQALQQRLSREYPALQAATLKPSGARPSSGSNRGAFQLRSLSMQGGLFAGNVFAQALADATGWNVATFPDGGLERNLQPVSFTTVHAAGKDDACARPVEVATVLVSGEHLFESLPLECPLARGGALIVSSVQSPEALWRGLSRRAANWVKEGNHRFHVLDARRIAAETAAHASFIDQLSIWALLGAHTRAALSFDDAMTDALVKSLRARLRDGLGADPGTIDAIVKAFARGAAELHEVPWKEWLDHEHALGEPDAPWTVRDGAGHDGTVFDPVRFWQSVGYLYDRGQSALTLADPYLATGIVPARSSAFRDMTRYRLRIPEWIPSKCTGCGECWVQCPESALPPTTRSIGELIDAGSRACEQSGGAFVQLKRLTDAITKQAYKLARETGPRPYDTLSALLEPAFARVADKAGLSGEKLDAARAEFARLVAAAGNFPVAVTDAFFARAHEREAGSGRLLSIALNPNSCTACGICVAACPEQAFAWAEQTPERVARCRGDWEFLMRLPAIAPAVVEEAVVASDSATQANRLLDTAVYHSLVGGDGSFPGNGAKTAVHLLTATIESVMRPRQAAHVERLTRLIERLEQRIQGTVDATTRINDFEEFGQRLSRVAGGALTPEALRNLAAEEKASDEVDAKELKRLTDLLQALREQKLGYTAGNGRARLVLTMDPAAGSFWNGTYPYNPHAQPWASHLGGDAVALARGVSEGLVRRLVAEFALCRKAERELDGGNTDAPSSMGWRDLTREERGLVPPVVVLAHAARTDATMVAGALAGGLPIHVALVDHDGVVMDGNAPAPHAEIAALHASGGAFVLQTSIGAPGHLMRGVAEAVERGGPALHRIHAPDPVADGTAAEETAELARLAYTSRAVPLFVARPDGPDAGLSLDGNPDTGAAWSTHEITVQDPSGASATVRATLTVADWAARQARFRRHFRVMSKGHRGAQMKPLGEYLALPAEARGSLEPYIDVRDRDGRHAVAVVSAEMVRAAERAALAWKELRALARGATPAAERAAQAAVATGAAPAAAPATAGADAVQRLADNLLTLAGYGHDEPFFRRRLREFVSQGKGGDA
jgi:pyruvate-ferredoxin/flavodoxin oxidoreductase